jgi:hypothetical protein
VAISRLLTGFGAQARPSGRVLLLDVLADDRQGRAPREAAK